MASTLTDGTYMIRFSTMPTKTGMYRYDVFIDNELVFIGNTYLEGNKNPIIDINDIVMNYNEPLHPKSYGTIAQKSKLLRTVKIKLYLDEPSEIESQVLMIYENPYYNSKVTTPILDNWVTNSIGEMPMLQGWNSTNQNGAFIPTYPAVATPNFTFDYLASKENLPLYHSLNVEYNGGKIDSGVQNFSVPDMSVFQITQPLQWLLRGVTEENIPICEAKELNMVVFSPVNAAVKYEMTVAKFDNKSRFFLKWKDRYGMAQCQPFSGTELYEENFEKTHTKNFKNERKLVQITNQPKWKLNSNWINQDLYPFYESIFVSPWLQLYDAKFDKLYEVLLTDNTYTEKTFKNQGRQLFNLQLEVEQSKTQNMLF